MFGVNHGLPRDPADDTARRCPLRRADFLAVAEQALSRLEETVRKLHGEFVNGAGRQLVLDSLRGANGNFPDLPTTLPEPLQPQNHSRTALEKVGRAWNAQLLRLAISEDDLNADCRSVIAAFLGGAVHGVEFRAAFLRRLHKFPADLDKEKDVPQDPRQPPSPADSSDSNWEHVPTAFREPCRFASGSWEKQAWLAYAMDEVCARVFEAAPRGLDHVCISITQDLRVGQNWTPTEREKNGTDVVGTAHCRNLIAGGHEVDFRRSVAAAILALHKRLVHAGYRIIRFVQMGEKGVQKWFWGDFVVHLPGIERDNSPVPDMFLHFGGRDLVPVSYQNHMRDLGRGDFVLMRWDVYANMTRKIGMELRARAGRGRRPGDGQIGDSDEDLLRNLG